MPPTIKVIEIVSVNVARPTVLVRWPDKDVLSAIDKRPVTSPFLQLTRLNLGGDQQADTRPTPQGGQVHGGIDQAVYAFPFEHYAAFEWEMGRTLAPGFVGENLTVRGERKRNERISQDTFRRQERPMGRWSRTVTLPERVDSDKISASFASGILASFLGWPARHVPRWHGATLQRVGACARRASHSP